MIRTLIGAAEPEPIPILPSTWTTTVLTSDGVNSTVTLNMWAVPTAPTVAQPYRTTAYVGEHVPEIEA